MPTISIALAAFIAYFSLYVLILLGLSFFIHQTENHNSKKSFFKALWNKKDIYGQILVHLYDTGTDIGVLVQWALLAQSETKGNNIESVNMLAMFMVSLGFLVLYRVFCVILSIISAQQDHATSRTIACDIMLAFADMYLMKIIYHSIKQGETEPTTKQRMLQITEALFESLPQAVLQSVFIIRIQNDDKLGGKHDLYLVVLSLFASMISITTKYVWLDSDCVVTDATDSNFSTECPIVNQYYLLRVIWRLCFIIARFAIFTLLWSVVGGMFLCIFAIFSWLFWCFWIYIQIYVIQNSRIGDNHSIYSYALLAGYGFISFVSTIAHQSHLFLYWHLCETIAALFIVTLFTFNTSIECTICAKSDERQFNSNLYIKIFVTVGWLFFVIDCITYFLLLRLQLFERRGNGVFHAFEEGIEESLGEHENIDARILMVGLDAVGKTVILYKIKTGKTVTTIPTHFVINVETVHHRWMTFTIWDMGGHDKYRPHWRHYFHCADIVVFVVGSTDALRLDAEDMYDCTVKYELHRLLNEDELSDAMFLVLCNKQDLPNAMSVDQINERLSFMSSSSTTRKCHIMGTCGLTGEGLHEAFDWICDNWYDQKCLIKTLSKHQKIGSKLLTIKEDLYFIQLLTSRLATIVGFQLLYRASENGYDVINFHQQCDNKAPTLIIIQSEYGHIFGGYTKVKWSSNNNTFGSDDDAFLFLIRSEDISQKCPILFDVINHHHAIFSDKHAGPCFGSGYDIHIGEHCNESRGNYCCRQHHSTYGCSGDVLCGGYFREYKKRGKKYKAKFAYFKVVDYEVFQLTFRRYTIDSGN
eukprot:108715_1